LLFEKNQNLVAVVEGNAPDDFSSIIDFTIPSGDAGNPGAPDPNQDLFNYSLPIQGATGSGPVDRFANRLRSS
jgi:hypothetical protein